jgi:hypothetical protein
VLKQGESARAYLLPLGNGLDLNQRRPRVVVSRRDGGPIARGVRATSKLTHLPPFLRRLFIGRVDFVDRSMAVTARRLA